MRRARWIALLSFVTSVVLACGGAGRTNGTASAATRDTTLDARRLPTPTAPDLPGDPVRLPDPTGPFRVGTATYGLRLAEPEPLTDDPDDRREVVVQLFYPARRTVEGASAAYLPRIDDMRRGLREHGFPPFAELADRLDRYRRVRTHARPEAPILSREGPFPIVLFSPGGNTSRHGYTGLYEELASHGYVVAAMSHAHSGLDVFPEAGFLASHRRWHPGSDVPADERAARDDQLSARLATDARVTLDFLTELQAGRCDGDAPGDTGAASRGCGPPGIRGSLDPERVAIVGHSRGGSTVTRGCATDPRFDACVVFDNIGSEPETEEGLGRPQLALRPPWSEARTVRLHDFLAANRTLAFEVVVPGAVHMSFTDLPLVDPEAHPPGDLAPLEAHRLVATVTLGFLNEHVRGREGAFPALLARLGPDVRATAF